MSKKRVKRRRLPLLVQSDYKGLAEIPTRHNFLPVLLPAITVIGVGIGGVELAKKFIAPGPKVAALISVPVVIGAGGSYVAAESLKLSTEMKAALTLVGGGIGWAIQFYALAPVDEARVAEAAEAAKTEREANFRWYNPFSWA